jgi:hypothetical protein
LPLPPTDGTIIEIEDAKIATLATEGFRDTIENGHGSQSQQYDSTSICRRSCVGAYRAPP